MQHFDFHQYVIDVARSVPPGNFCFLPTTMSDGGELAVATALAVYGSKPPVADGEIVGMIYEGPPNLLEEWERQNSEWLAQLNIRRN